MYIKVKPKRSSLKLGKCVELAPRYYEPFDILARIGPVTYQLPFPAKSKNYNVFHVLLLKKTVFMTLTM